MAILSGRDTEGNLFPQEEISDSSAVLMWMFFIGGRRWKLERETGRKGRRVGQEPRLLANLGRRRETNSFAPSKRSGSSETIPGNLLFLLPKLPLKKCRQNISINNQKGRKVPGKSCWEAQTKAGIFPGPREGQACAWPLVEEAESPSLVAFVA